VAGIGDRAWRGSVFMTFSCFLRLARIAAVAVLCAPGLAGLAAAAPVDGVHLAPHRAVYDLKLLRANGPRGIDSVRGRIVYDFSGNACDGYDLNFRQVSELDSGEGKAILTDLSSSTWEAADARSFRFSSQNRTNDKAEKVNGEADRGGKQVAIKLTKPKRTALIMPPSVVFPTEQMRRIIASARAGQNFLQMPVYDGSETGEKLYNTFTLIGQAIPPGARPPHDATAKVPALARLTRWPVTISYFEQRSDSELHNGEQTPVYTLGFELYENGISRALVLDYSDFAISGEMTSLEMKKETACK
jgi:hypothetical protein